jgi:hypothetical protein
VAAMLMAFIVMLGHRLQLVAVIMIMIVISLGFVRVKGIAHWVASGKVPVAK